MSGFIPAQNSNTSSTGGFLVPVTGPTSKTEFEDTVSSIISGLTGIPSSLVRPRWQPTPPTQPSFDTNWVAFGVVRRVRDANPYIRHTGGLDDGQDELQRHVLIETLCSFYGPDSMDLSEVLRDGLRIEQNYWPLLAINAQINNIEESIRMPELINNQWVDRTDLTIRFIQQEIRTYSIESLVSADSQLNTENYVTASQVRNIVDTFVQLDTIKGYLTTGGGFYEQDTREMLRLDPLSLQTTYVYGPAELLENNISSFSVGDFDFQISSNVGIPSAVVYSGIMGSLLVADTQGIPLSLGTESLTATENRTLNGISISSFIGNESAVVLPGSPGNLNAAIPNQPLLLSDGNPILLSNGNELTT